MCGITGFCRQAGVAPYGPALQAATDVIAYRGPDDQGFLAWDSQRGGAAQAAPRVAALDLQGADVLLGHRRLSILDLSPLGHQPMASPDGRAWIVYNGEVYNYLELRDELRARGHEFRSGGDTEVLLAAYREWGAAALARCNGMWAFAILDLERGELFAARDRFGVKPLHYHHAPGVFAFGSEIKQLLAFDLVPRRPDAATIADYLAYGAVDHGPATFYEGIAHLPPGHWLRYDLRRGTLQVAPWYQPTLTIQSHWTAPAAAARLRELLTDSVRLRLRSDVEVGSCLSGGLDSSALVCLMQRQLQAQQQAARQRTFSAHFDEPEANERHYMDTVIAATGVQAAFTQPTADEMLAALPDLLYHQEEPFGGTSIFAQYAVFKLAHAHGVKVMLDGQGADELMGGYPTLANFYFQELLAQRRYPRLAWQAWRYHRRQGLPLLPTLARGGVPLLSALAARLHPPPAPPPAPRTWLRPAVAHLAAHGRYVENQRHRPFGEPAAFCNLLYQYTFHNHLQALLKYEDRNSMAFSVESRVPFLDYRLVEFLLQVPPHLKLHAGYTKHVLRTAMDGILPPAIQWRVSKLGFATPERGWRAGSLRPLVLQALASERLAPYVDPVAARAAYEESVARDLPDASFWRWINLDLWLAHPRLW